MPVERAFRDSLAHGASGRACLCAACERRRRRSTSVDFRIAEVAQAWTTESELTPPYRVGAFVVSDHEPSETRVRARDLHATADEQHAYLAGAVFGDVTTVFTVGALYAIAARG